MKKTTLFICALIFISCVIIAATTCFASELRINSLKLYFDNNKVEITVKKRTPSLKAYADINFSGTGALQGYWRVDNRILSQVSMHLTSGKPVTIETPDVPSLPTFSPGTHTVQLIITTPDQEIAFPKALYHVTSDQQTAISAITLIAPAENAAVDYNITQFKWNKKNESTLYLIEFLDADTEASVVSAYAVESEYKLPKPVLKTYFSSDKSYLWRVKGFDSLGNIICESRIGNFTFK